MEVAFSLFMLTLSLLNHSGVRNCSKPTAATSAAAAALQTVLQRYVCEIIRVVITVRQVYMPACVMTDSSIICDKWLSPLSASQIIVHSIARSSDIGYKGEQWFAWMHEMIIYCCAITEVSNEHGILQRDHLINVTIMYNYIIQNLLLVWRYT